MVEPDCLEQEGHNCQVEATGVWGRARGVCNMCLLRENFHNLLSDSMLPRRAVACNSSTLTSSRCTKHRGMPAGGHDCLKAEVAAMNSPQSWYHMPGETKVTCSNTLLPADWTAAGRQAHVPSWQVEATIRPSALRMRLLEVCHDTADTRRTQGQAVRLQRSCLGRCDTDSRSDRTSKPGVSGSQGTRCRPRRAG